MKREEIKPTREAAGMSQSELAQRLGQLIGKPISRQYINQLEDATNAKTSASATRLAELAGIMEKAATLNKMVSAAWQK